ncbi:MAG: hypothetical protein AAF598_04195 [Bacteroidota bacterium]
MDLADTVGRFSKHFLFGLQKLFDGIDFMRKEKLWKGVFRYGFVGSFMVLVGLFVGIKFINVFVNWYHSMDASSASGLASSIGNLFASLGSEGYELFFLGGMKYVVLIIMEVVIFHFVRRTITILSGEEQEANFKAFVAAEIRMIKVSFIAFVLETIFSSIAQLGLGLVGLHFLKPVAAFGIQCYFLGWVVIDNYFELYGMKIKPSLAATKYYAGLSVVLGLALYILLLIPLIGAFLAPLFGAVVATLAMYELQNRDDQMMKIIPDFGMDQTTMPAMNYVESKTVTSDLEDHF